MTKLRTDVTIESLNRGGEEYLPGYLGTVREGSVSCTATARHLGRTTQVLDAVVTDGATGRRIALFRCTQMTLWPKA